MAHYAFINEENIVTEVIVGKDEADNTDLPEGFADWEAWYGDFRGQTCKRTSYNTFANAHNDGGTAFRGNYAGIGYTYNTENDVFYPPKPYESWTLNNDWIWEAPVDYPNDNNIYTWDEELYQSDNTQGWVLNS